MALISVNGGRVWIIPVEADPTGSVTPSQAPVIAVLATNPPPGATGAWYNSGTSSASWRPLISAAGSSYTLPENLQTLSDANGGQLIAEQISLFNSLTPAGLNQSPVGDLSKLIGKLIYGIARQYFLTCGDPAAVVDGQTLVVRWKDAGEPVTLTFAMNRSGAYVPNPGEIPVDISAATNATGFAIRLQEALYLNLPGGMGRENQQWDQYIIVATSFAGRDLAADTWNLGGTVISSGNVTVQDLGYGGAPLPQDPMMMLQGYLAEIVRAAEQQCMFVQIGNAVDPRETTVEPVVFGKTAYPDRLGQLLYTADGTKAFRRTTPANRDGGTGLRDFVPLHKTRTYRGTEENVGTLFGYFDSPLLHALKAKRAVRLRWVILGVNSAAQAKDILPALRVTATGNVTNFTMAKQIFTMGTPSEGPVVLHQGMAGLDYSGNGEIPLLLDFNLPIQSNGSGGTGIAAGGSFGICIEMTLRIADQLNISNLSGLGNNADLRRDLAFFRLDWDAWYRDSDNLNPTPLAHAHGEAQIFDANGGLAFEIERLGIQTKANPGDPDFWGQVSAIDPGSYVEIEYL